MFNSKYTINIKSGQLLLDVESSDLPLSEICGFASRQNPKRGFLFVSKVLGKHYPVKPSKMQEIYNLLSQKISINENSSALFLGFAETATGLSSGIYDTWKQNNSQSSYFIHTTRYQFDGKQALFNFHEEHSHATGHIVYQPEDQQFRLEKFDTLVLIDDEITTGKTMTNFIDEFLKLDNCHVKKIVVVCIKNWMVPESVDKFNSCFPDVKIEFVQILKGTYEFIKNDSFVCESMPNVDGNGTSKNDLITKNHGRFGSSTLPKYNFSSLKEKFDLNKKTLVLGTGEFSYHPFLMAKYLEEAGCDVKYQSTTRSPILVGNDIGHKITFKDNYGDNISNFIYNVQPGQYEQVIICYETNKIEGFNLDQQLNASNVFFEEFLEI